MYKRQDTYRVAAKPATKKIAFAVTPSGEFADCAKIEVHVKPDSGTAGVAKTFEVTRPSKDAPFNFTSEIFNLGDQTGDNTYNAEFLVAIVPSEGGFDEPAPDAASGIDMGAKSPKTGLATGAVAAGSVLLLAAAGGVAVALRRKLDA